MTYILSYIVSQLILLFNTSINVTQETLIRQQYNEWKSLNNILFQNQEDEFRFIVYKDNLQQIEQHNLDNKQTYKLGQNKFMHLTQEEFVELYLDNSQIQNENNRIEPEIEQLKFINLNASIDWSNFTIVKEQGACVAGWAFSVTGTMEVYQRAWYSKNVSISEQQLIDCDTLSRGCVGGSNLNGYKYAVSNGLSSQSEYPYVGYNQTCQRKYGSYQPVRYNSAFGEYSMKQALNSHPVSAGLDAQNWQFYQSGVFSNCGITQNHYAVVVGYEEDGTWILKNSWGINWGEKGFIRIKSGNTCGVLTYSYQDQY